MPIRPGCPGSEENRTKDLHTKPLRQDPMAWRESANRHYSSRTILRGVIGTRCWLGPAEGARYGKESLGSSSYRLSKGIARPAGVLPNEPAASPRSAPTPGSK
jgi:hypothetical protein